ncbi:MAG: response regulator [Alphaproteobacteria bacterium]|nr:response regulator [Alphaproteobacteria bacterium]
MAGGLILLGDPDEESRSRTAKLLQDAGYSVMEFDSGEQLIQRLATVEPSMVILDTALYGLDGLEAVRRGRGMIGGGKVPFFILTDKKTLGDVRDALEAGGHDYYLKDGIDKLMARIGLWRQAKMRMEMESRRQMAVGRIDDFLENAAEYGDIRHYIQTLDREIMSEVLDDLLPEIEGDLLGPEPAPIAVMPQKPAIAPPKAPPPAAAAAPKAAPPPPPRAPEPEPAPKAAATAPAAPPLPAAAKVPPKAAPQPAKPAMPPAPAVAPAPGPKKAPAAGQGTGPEVRWGGAAQPAIKVAPLGGAKAAKPGNGAAPIASLKPNGKAPHESLKPTTPPGVINHDDPAVMDFFDALDSDPGSAAKPGA